jgi:hypothetical protein
MAYHFNGATHQIIRSDAPIATWPITIHARVRLPTSDSNEHYICGFHESANGNGHYLRTSFTGGTQKLRMTSRDSGVNSAAQSTTSLTIGQWHSCVGEVTAAAARGSWIDNGGNGSNIVSISPGTLAKTSIGAFDAGGTLSSNVDHEVADVAMWSGLLSSDDRAALAAGVSPAFIRPDILEVYVPLIRGGQDKWGGAFTVNNATVVDHPRVFMPCA